MKKYLPYIFAGLVVIAVLGLFFTASDSKRTLDERLSFRRRDKIPYGVFVAYENLKHLFPKASIVTSREEPGYWDSVSVYADKQAIIIVSPQFNADKYELKNLIRFAENGNDVFISTMDIPYEVLDIFKCAINTSEHLISYFSQGAEPDTLTVSLARPPFNKPLSYTYPGKQYDGYFSKLDSSTSTVLGYDKKGRPDFIHLKTGKGNFYVHLAPMVFTNYFLLHKNNIACYEFMISLISPATKRVVWDEYFLYKPTNQNQSRKKNWLAAILGAENAAGRKPFAAAFWLLLAILLIFVLQEMRRKQRFIPVIKKPKNDSLDFVKTIGRLYHDKGDHRNLCRKMAAYFLEHVRTRYKLATSKLDDEFVNNLHFKTGIEEAEINSIVSSIKQIENAYSVSDTELTAFHKQLELFYKKA